MRRKAKESPQKENVYGDRISERKPGRRKSERVAEPRILNDYNFSYSPAVKLEQLEQLLTERKISEADYFLWKRVYMNS